MIQLIFKCHTFLLNRYFSTPPAPRYAPWAVACIHRKSDRAARGPSRHAAAMIEIKSMPTCVRLLITYKNDLEIKQRY